MSLREKTLKGLTWSGMSQVITQISQLLITTILARLLTPNDFGLLGMTVVFTNFLNIFCEMGISGALIQKQDISETQYSSVFWLNIIVGIVLMLLTMAISPCIASFYNKPELKPIVMMISVNFPIMSFVIVQKAIFSKEMSFKKLAIAEVIAVIVAGIIGISMAYLGHGVWSLVYRMLIFTAANTLLLWWLSAWRPKFIFSLKALKEVFPFSFNLMGFNLVNYFARNIDNILIGKFLGVQALGYYTLAYRLMLYPVQNISGVVGKVMFPAFSMIQDDLEKVRTTYMKMVKAISLVTFPIMCVLFAVTPEFVHVIFGPQWQPMVILIQILCICGIFQAIGTTVGYILLSQGRADLQFKMQVIGTILVTIFIITGLKWGVIGVTVLYTLYSIFWVHFFFYVTNKIINLRYKEFYSKIFSSYLMGAIITGSLLLIRQFLTSSPVTTLITLICSGLFIYISLLIISKHIVFHNRSICVNILEP